MAVPCWVVPGAVEQALALIGSNVAPIAGFPAEGRIVCARPPFKRTSPGCSFAQSAARYGPADLAVPGQVVDGVEAVGEAQRDQMPPLVAHAETVDDDDVLDVVDVELPHQRAADQASTAGHLVRAKRRP